MHATASYIMVLNFLLLGAETVLILTVILIFAIDLGIRLFYENSEHEILNYNSYDGSAEF